MLAIIFQNLYILLIWNKNFGSHTSGLVAKPL